jgi:hypothetical protein
MPYSVTKWTKSNLKYKIVKPNRELGEGSTRLAIHKAFKYWSDVTNLKFEEVCSSCSSDLVVDFLEYAHNDGANFDGPNGVLAHAFYPQVGIIIHSSWLFFL